MRGGKVFLFFSDDVRGSKVFFRKVLTQSLVVVVAVSVALPFLLGHEQLGEEESLEEADADTGEKDGEDTLERCSTGH